MMARIPATVFAGSRFATLTATSCSSVDQGRRRCSDAGFKDILSVGFLLFGLESAADPEHVAIRMSKVHLANVPRHIGVRLGFAAAGDNLSKALDRFGAFVKSWSAKMVTA